MKPGTKRWLARRHPVTFELTGAELVILEVMHERLGKMGKSREDIVADALRFLFEEVAGPVDITVTG